MKSLLLVSFNLELEVLVSKTAVVSSGQASVSSTASFGQSFEFWQNSPPDVLVLWFPEESFLREHFFRKLRQDVLRAQPIVVICGQVDSELLQLSNIFQNMRFVREPVSVESLNDVLEGICTDRPAESRQRHQRYITDVECEFAVGADEIFYPAKILNLSMGGALVEVDPRPVDLQELCSVVLRISLKEIKKGYYMEAKVLWIKEETGSTRFGVSFLHNEALYNTLLAKSAKDSLGF